MAPALEKRPGGLNRPATSNKRRAHESQARQVDAGKVQASIDNGWAHQSSQPELSGRGRWPKLHTPENIIALLARKVTKADLQGLQNGEPNPLCVALLQRSQLVPPKSF